MPKPKGEYMTLPSPEEIESAIERIKLLTPVDRIEKKDFTTALAILSALKSGELVGKESSESVSYDEILKTEGLVDWTYKITSGGGLCLYDKKELWVLSNNFALFLHEVAHALCPKEKCGVCWVETNNGHNAIWGDTFTSLVKKYMVEKQLQAKYMSVEEVEEIILSKIMGDRKSVV